MICDRHHHHGPIIGVIECPNAQAMKSRIRMLDEFPCINIPCNARDSQYQVVTKYFVQLEVLCFIFSYASGSNHLLRFCSVLLVGTWLAGCGSKNWNAAMCCIISVVEWENFSFKICTCNMPFHPLHHLILHVFVISSIHIPLFIWTFVEVITGALGKFWTRLASIYCWYLLFQGITGWATG